MWATPQGSELGGGRVGGGCVGRRRCYVVQGSFYPHTICKGDAFDEDKISMSFIVRGRRRVVSGWLGEQEQRGARIGEGELGV